jgi:TPR repeat protein
MLWRRLLTIALLSWSLGASAQPAKPKLLALVIGNGAYAQLGALPNPKRDAALVSEALREAGYSVEQASDLTASRLAEKLRSFRSLAASAPPGSVIVLYYAGHGFAVNGQSIILPTDSRIEAGQLDMSSAVTVDSLLRSLGGSDQVHKVLVVDACRNLLAFRQSGVQVSTLAETSKPPNAFVLYSTGNGVSAADGAAGEYSPFAVSFVRQLETAGESIGDFATDVARAVLNRTLQSQQPESFSSLRSRLVLNDKPVSVASGLYVRAHEAFNRGDAAGAAEPALAAARLGDTRAMILYGDLLYYGSGVPRSVQDAILWYHKAANAGDSEGYLALGTTYLSVAEVQDVRQAAEWFEKGIAAGNQEAMYALAHVLQDDTRGMKNVPRAIELYEKSLTAYNCCSAVNLAVLYFRGDDVPRNLALAERYGRMAHDRGNYKGTHVLAGIAIERKDYAAAKGLFLEAVDRGSAYAANQLGVMAANGWGEPKDRVVAAEWFRKALSLATKSHDESVIIAAKKYLAAVGATP